MVRLERSDEFFLAAAFGFLRPGSRRPVRRRSSSRAVAPVGHSSFILWLAGRTYGHVRSRLLAGAASAIAISGLVLNLPRYKNFTKYFHEYFSAGEFIDPIPSSCRFHLLITGLGRTFVGLPVQHLTH